MKLLKQVFHQTRRVIAKLWLTRMRVTQIAITGSQGKTAVSQGLYAMLSTLRPTVVTDVNLDTIYNVPITALKTRPYHQYAIFELGIDKLNEMSLHLDIVKPDVAVITGVSPVHSDESHMKSFENVKKEKRKLIESLSENSVAILNYSDENVRTMATYTKAKVIWYGSEVDFKKELFLHVRHPELISPTIPGQAGSSNNKMLKQVQHDTISNYVSYSNINVTTNGTEFDLHDSLDVSNFFTLRQAQCDKNTNSKTTSSCHPAAPFRSLNERRMELDSGSQKVFSQKNIHIKTKLIGTFHAANIAAIYCILKTLNPYFVKNFEQGVLELLTPLKGRMSIENGPKETLILNDSLRANPTSTTAGLETFINIDYKNGRKVAIIADMGELEKPELEHKKVGKLIAGLPIDMIVCAGKMQKFVAIEAARNKKIEVHYYDTVADAKKEIMRLINPKDFIYLKGSKYSYVGKILDM